MSVNIDILSTEELFEIIIWKMRLEVVKKKKKVDLSIILWDYFQNTRKGKTSLQNKITVGCHL